MTIKRIFFAPALVLTMAGSFVANSSALSMHKQLFEQVEQSTLVVVGVVSESRVLFKASDDGRHMSQLGKIYKIKVEKVVKGEGIAEDILIFEKLPLTMESALYSEGDRVLMFLNEASIDPELFAKTKILKGDELTLLREPKHYMVVSGSQGCLYLGLDPKSAVKNKVSNSKYYRRAVDIDSKMSPERIKNQKYLQSTEEFVRITKIKNEQDRERAWEKAAAGADELLKESARIKLNNTHRK